MTAYEIHSIVLGILALLISLGNMFVALLTFSIRERSENKKAYPVSPQDRPRP